MKRGLYYAAALAVSFVCLYGCGGQRTDTVEKAEKKGVLVVAVPEHNGEDSSRQWAAAVEIQVIEELCRDLGIQARYVDTPPDSLKAAVEEQKADIAAGAVVMGDSGNEGYSLTYGSKPLYIVSGDGKRTGSLGKLANQTAGIEAGVGREVKRQFYSVAGIKLVEYQSADEVKPHIEDDKIAGYVCYEDEARALLAEEGLSVQDLNGIRAESYAFYAGEGQYRILGEINRLLTDKLRE